MNDKIAKIQQQIACDIFYYTEQEMYEIELIVY